MTHSCCRTFHVDAYQFYSVGKFGHSRCVFFTVISKVKVLKYLLHDHCVWAVVSSGLSAHIIFHHLLRVCVGNSFATLFPCVFVFLICSLFWISYDILESYRAKLFSRRYHHRCCGPRPQKWMCANDLNVNVPHFTYSVFTHTNTTRTLRARVYWYIVRSMCEFFFFFQIWS